MGLKVSNSCGKIGQSCLIVRMLNSYEMKAIFWRHQSFPKVDTKWMSTKLIKQRFLPWYYSWLGTKRQILILY